MEEVYEFEYLHADISSKENHIVQMLPGVEAIHTHLLNTVWYIM